MIFKMELSKDNDIINKEELNTQFEYFKSKLLSYLNFEDKDIIRIGFSIKNNVKFNDTIEKYTTLIPINEIILFIMFNNGALIKQNLPVNQEFNEDIILRHIKKKVFKECLN